MNWQKEFESFMAQQPDHEGVPVWDRFLWWFHKNGACGWSDLFKPHNRHWFVLAAFTWCDTDEDYWFWTNLDKKWRDHVEKLERAK